MVRLRFVNAIYIIQEYGYGPDYTRLKDRKDPYCVIINSGGWGAGFLKGGGGAMISLRWISGFWEEALEGQICSLNCSNSY